MNLQDRVVKKFQILTLTSIAVSICAGQARAGTHTWSGAASGLWSVPGNWASGGPPTNGESPLHRIFPSVAQRLHATNDISGLQLDSLTFSGLDYILYGLAGKSITLKGGTNITCSFDCAIDGSLPVVLANTNYVNVESTAQ